MSSAKDGLRLQEAGSEWCMLCGCGTQGAPGAGLTDAAESATDAGMRESSLSFSGKGWRRKTVYTHHVV
jgi:hypothetical protein